MKFLKNTPKSVPSVQFDKPTFPNSQLNLNFYKAHRENEFGKRLSDEREIAQINLYNDSNQNIGNVRFYRDSQNIPDNASNETSNPKQVRLRMPERQIDSVVNMLRNEKPCFVTYSSQTFAYIHTGSEPVGEDE